VVNLQIDNCPTARPTARSLSTLALLVGSLSHTLVASAQTNSTNSPEPAAPSNSDSQMAMPPSLQPIPDHAQLDSERQVMEVERIDLPLFLDVQ
jgi:hypothetical protein